VSLAEDKFALSRTQTTRLDKQFVRDLLLSLITPPEVENYGELIRPSGEDRKLLDQARRAITKFPRIEGISADDVRKRMDPIIKGIAEILQIIPADFDFKDFRVVSSEDRRIFDALVRWSNYKPTLGQLKAVSKLVGDYNEQVIANTREVSAYIKLIDNFLGHTGKSAGFNSHGALEIRSGSRTFAVEDLSSGEAQVIVILTHLAFNDDVENAGVFIVDEPELSLHIVWQEMLVSSMRQANSDVQYVLATHSPSIIMDRVDCAIDLNKDLSLQ
jgi:predicted ATP-dependent endonuclease of OLD family